jgi:hypothetical protein
MSKYIAPSIDLVSFNCPHSACGALAKQFWFSAYVEPMKKDTTPLILDADKVIGLNLAHVKEAAERDRLKSWAARMATGRPFIESERTNVDCILNNVSVSQCYSCNDISIWIYDRMVYPVRGEAPLPNLDLPEDIRADYDEASTILDLSPRGAAALLRLSIQKLCAHLGEPGKDINKDIGSLVKKGLDPRVQKALDVVRVIGNESVHPGQIDLRDDRSTAEKLFGLVNLIAEIMISQPKHVAEMYAGLPEGKLKAIERRDS